MNLLPFVGNITVDASMLDIIPLVNVLDPLRQSRASHNSCVSCLKWQSGSSTGSAAVVAFCVSGRCFCEAAAWKSQTRPVKGPVGQPHDVKPTSRGSVPARLTQASSTSGRKLTQHTGECRRRTQESDAAHNPSGPALCRDRSEQASKPTMRLAHDTGAWKFECTALGAWWAVRVFRDSNGWPKTLTDCDGRESRGYLFLEGKR